MKHYGLKIAEGTEIINATAPTGTSFPSGTESTGELFFRTDQNKLYCYNGSSWTDLSAGGLTAVVDDTSPELGGDLAVGAFSIVGTDGSAGSPQTVGGNVSIAAGVGGTGLDGGSVSISAGEGGTTGTDGSVTLTGKTIIAEATAGLGTTEFRVAGDSGNLLLLQNLNGGTDQKSWRIASPTGSYLDIGTWNDAGSGGARAIRITRSVSGQGIEKIDLYDPLRQNTGTAFAPGYSFASNSQAGMYYDTTTDRTGTALSINNAAMLTATDNGLVLKEVTAPSADVAGYGKLYVDGTDSNLKFRDDSGTVTDLTAGGISDVVEDTTPQLGGNLDVNGFDITSTAAGQAVEIRTANTAFSGAAIKLLPGDASGIYSGGTITLSSGNASGTGTGGHLYLYAGDSAGTGGNVDVRYGNDTTDGNSPGQFTIGVGKTTTTEQFRLDETGIRLREATTAPTTNTTSYGHLYIDPTSNNLTFRDEAGTVTDLITGGGGISNVVEDTTPQLGGHLDVNDQSIINGTAKLDLNDTTVTELFSASGTDGTQLNIIAGEGTAGNGGGTKIIGGEGSVTGGTVTIQSGDGGTGNAGDITLQLGSGVSNLGGFVQIKPPTGSTTAPNLILYEAATNGTSGIWLRAPNSISANRFWTLPDDDPSTANGQFLTTDASGNLSFAAGGIANVVDDTTPQLGGHLDAQNNYIYSSTGTLDLKFPTQHTGAGPGYGIDLTGQQGTGATSWGGFIQITGGNSTSVVGGNVTLTGGSGGTGGGDIRIDGGHATTSGSGGDVFIRPGYNTNTSSSLGDVVLQPTVAGATVALKFREDSTNGTNWVALKAPASITADRTWTLPNDDPSTANGQFLTTDASGNLSFADAGLDGVTSVPDGSPVTYHIGINETSPLKPLHVVGKGGNVTTTPTIGGNDVVIIENGDSNAANMSFISGTQTALKFYTDASGSPALTGYRGRLRYSHATDSFDISVAGGDSQFAVESDGTLNVAGTTDYELLVTADDDVPNKKYVDDAIIAGRGGNTPTAYVYTATASQTSFSGSDDNANTLAYTVGDILVYLNGVLLNASDYTATTGTSVVLNTGATLNDILTIVAVDTWSSPGGSQETFYYATSTSNLTIGTVATTSAAILDFGTITIPTTGLISITGIVAQISAGASASAMHYSLLVNGVAYELGRYNDSGTWEAFSQTVGASSVDIQEGTFGAAAPTTRHDSLTLDIAHSSIATGSQNVKLVMWASTAATLQGATTTSRATLSVVDLT